MDIAQLDEKISICEFFVSFWAERKICIPEFE